MGMCYQTVDLPLLPPGENAEAWQARVDEFLSKAEELIREGACRLSSESEGSYIEIDGQASGDRLEGLINQYSDLFGDVDWTSDELDTGFVYPRRIRNGQLQLTGGETVVVPGRKWYECLSDGRAMRNERAAVLADRGPRVVVDLPQEVWAQIVETLAPQDCQVLATIEE